MKNCPCCQNAPHFRFARNTSRARDAHFFIWIPCCARGEVFPRDTKAIPREDCAKVEDEWDAFCEGMFAAYTERWTEQQRTSYRARLWPVAVVLPMPPLPRREVSAVKAAVKAPEVRHYNEPQEPEDCPWNDAP